MDDTRDVMWVADEDDEDEDDEGEMKTTPKPKNSGGEYGTRRGRCVVEKGRKNGEGLGMGGGVGFT